MADALELAARPLTLAGLDELAAEDLLAFVTEDERPLRGLAGLCDWRLCGALVRHVRSGLLSGGRGDSVLTVPGRRLPARRLFLRGVGPDAGLDKERAGAALAQGLAAVAAAGGRDVATTPPGWGELPDAMLARRLLHAALAAKLSRVVLLAPDPRAAEAALRSAAEGRPGVRVMGAPPASDAHRARPAPVRAT